MRKFSFFFSQDNPDGGILYLAQGLNNIINQMKCFDEASETRVMLYMNMLCYMSTQIQTLLPYHIPKGKFKDLIRDDKFCCFY
jgi:hypothetical protein